MRKLVLQVSCVALALLLSLGILGMRPKDAETFTAKPNIVLSPLPCAAPPGLPSWYCIWHIP
jgi:hypothetical protein